MLGIITTTRSPGPRRNPGGRAGERASERHQRERANLSAPKWASCARSAASSARKPGNKSELNSTSVRSANQPSNGLTKSSQRRLRVATGDGSAQAKTCSAPVAFLVRQASHINMSSSWFELADLLARALRKPRRAQRGDGQRARGLVWFRRCALSLGPKRVGARSRPAAGFARGPASGSLLVVCLDKFKESRKQIEGREERNGKEPEASGARPTTTSANR